MSLRCSEGAACLTLFAVLAFNGSDALAALNYTCEQLAGMAEHFYELKDKGHDLTTVLSVIQNASENNSEKEALLSNTAIEIFIDPNIQSAGQARSLALAGCQD